jgi:hypothetical protein
MMQRTDGDQSASGPAHVRVWLSTMEPHSCGWFCGKVLFNRVSWRQVGPLWRLPNHAGDRGEVND